MIATKIESAANTHIIIDTKIAIKSDHGACSLAMAITDNSDLLHGTHY
jgi:hypothetical protein